MVTRQRHDALRSFASDVLLLRRVFADERTLARAVAQRLTELLGDPTWLSEEYRQPWEDRYRPHLLYVAPDGCFSVVALVWRPGQRTPVHDHVSWCVVGVYQGEEEEARYRLYDDGHERFLVETAREIIMPGQAQALVPPNEDIHQVVCVGQQHAISIHVYGADIGKLGSSINHCFDDLPIRTAAGGAAPLAWRDCRGGH